MLDFIRNHKRLMLIILALFVVPGLGLVGIQGFRGFFDNSANVASVNGHKITRQEYDDVMRGQLDRMRQSLGASFDATAFDTPALRNSVLDSLIEQRIIADQTQRLHLNASDDAVRRAILSIAVIQSLRKPDGSIDVDQYRQLLAAQGMTPEQFDERVRYQLISSQLSDSIQNSSFTPRALAEHLMQLSDQQREVQALTLRPADYRAKVQLSDAQLHAWYDAHKQDFRTPETATVDYVVLSAAALAAATLPSDADLQKYYNDNIAQYRTDPEVRASHILVAVPKDASAADRAKAKAKADAILAQVRQHPEQFADIAKKESDDKGSAANGGDLGYFGHGMMVKPFEDAAFALKPGQISDVVQSDFGYHVIQVTDLKPQATKPFDDVKGSIATVLGSQRAAKQFADSAESFTNTVYEQADSLKAAADKFKLPIHSATVSRGANPALGPTDPLNNPKLLAAIFADDSLKNKHNTPAVDAGNNTMIAAHVSQYQPAAVPPYAQVADAVKQKATDEQAATLARADGKARLADLLKSNATTGFAAPLKTSRANTQGLPAPAVAAVFKADAQKLPTYVGVDLGNAGYAIYRVNAVDAPAATDPAHLQAAQQQVAQIAGAAEWHAYLSALRANANVKIYGTPAATGTDSAAGSNADD